MCTIRNKSVFFGVVSMGLFAIFPANAMQQNDVTVSNLKRLHDCLFNYFSPSQKRDVMIFNLETAIAHFERTDQGNENIKECVSACCHWIGNGLKTLCSQPGCPDYVKNDADSIVILLSEALRQKYPTAPQQPQQFLAETSPAQQPIVPVQRTVRPACPLYVAVPPYRDGSPLGSGPTVGCQEKSPVGSGPTTSSPWSPIFEPFYVAGDGANAPHE